MHSNPFDLLRSSLWVSLWWTFSWSDWYRLSIRLRTCWPWACSLVDNRATTITSCTCSLWTSHEHSSLRCKPQPHTKDTAINISSPAKLRPIESFSLCLSCPPIDLQPSLTRNINSERSLPYRFPFKMAKSIPHEATYAVMFQGITKAKKNPWSNFRDFLFKMKVIFRSPN